MKYFCFVSICKYLLTAGLREHAFNVTQSWPGILKFSPGENTLSKHRFRAGFLHESDNKLTKSDVKVKSSC